jgi:hypothetical protein
MLVNNHPLYVASINGRPIRPKKQQGKEMSEMPKVTTTFATKPNAIEHDSPRPQVAPPPDDGSSAEVLISEQEVLFATTAAVPLQRRKIGHRLVAILRRMVVTLTDAAQPPRPHVPRREAYYFERARMAREMERL